MGNKQSVLICSIVDHLRMQCAGALSEHQQMSLENNGHWKVAIATTESTHQQNTLCLKELKCVCFRNLILLQFCAWVSCVSGLTVTRFHLSQKHSAKGNILLFLSCPRICMTVLGNERVLQVSGNSFSQAEVHNENTHPFV